MAGNYNKIGNTKTVLTSKARDMAYYDLLPIEYRNYLKDSSVNVSAESVWKALRKKGNTKKVIRQRFALMKENHRVAHEKLLDSLI